MGTGVRVPTEHNRAMRFSTFGGTGGSGLDAQNSSPLKEQDSLLTSKLSFQFLCLNSKCHFPKCLLPAMAPAT